MTEIENAYLNIPYDLYLFLKDNYEKFIKFEFSLKFNDCKFIFYNNPTEYTTKQQKKHDQWLAHDDRMFLRSIDTDTDHEDTCLLD